MPSSPYSDEPRRLRLPPAPVDRLAEPIARFLHVQSAGGAVLLVATVAALVLANSPWSGQFLGFWDTNIGLSVGAFEITHSLKHWINDGLMVIFFFVIGLEVKREIVLGELRDLRTASLPIAAALGGMVVPASVYLSMQWGEPGARGWGIPMATDIAFVVGCMAILGSRVPRGLRVLLLTLAIADDIGAILVIAIGYTSDLNLTALGLAVLAIGVILLFQRIGVRSIPIYVVVGIALWFAIYESGVHATIAGVALGLMTPARPWVSRNMFVRYVQEIGDFLQGDLPDDDENLLLERRSRLETLTKATRESVSPLVRLETMLHPWVSFGIMPLFALANAGVTIDVASFADPLALAVSAGLVIGKPVGIVLFSFLAVRIGLARLPVGVNWPIVAAGGLLAGIGFTMSLFIAELALKGDLLDAAKIGVLAGSAVAAAGGMILLLLTLPKRAAATT
jgi:NhaA family Na+:H+ antiporter